MFFVVNTTENKAYLILSYLSPPERAVGSGRGRTAVTGRWDGLLKQTAQIPGADCFRIPSERAVDGLSWRAAGMDFWNKCHGFLVPIVSKVSQSGPWTAGRDGPLGWTFETNGADSLRRLLQKSIRADRGVGPWTAGRDGPPGWTFETNGTDSWRRLLQKFVRAGRGSRPWTAGRDGLLRWTFETNGTDSWRRLLQKFVRAGRGSRPWTDGRDGLLRWIFETNGTDSWHWLFQKSVRSGRAC